MRCEPVENFGDDKPKIEHHSNRERGMVCRQLMRMFRMVVVVHRPNLGTSDPAARSLNSCALEKGAKDFFGFEELAGDFAGGQGVAGVIGVDAFHSFRDFA